jgi:hypothetical protein
VSDGLYFGCRYDTLEYQRADLNVPMDHAARPTIFTALNNSG